MTDSDHPAYVLSLAYKHREALLKLETGTHWLAPVNPDMLFESLAPLSVATARFAATAFIASRNFHLGRNTVPDDLLPYSDERDRGQA